MNGYTPFICDECNGIAVEYPTAMLRPGLLIEWRAFVPALIPRPGEVIYILCQHCGARVSPRSVADALYSACDEA